MAILAILRFKPCVRWYLDFSPIPGEHPVKMYLAVGFGISEDARIVQVAALEVGVRHGVVDGVVHASLAGDRAHLHLAVRA